MSPAGRFVKKLKDYYVEICPDFRKILEYTYWQYHGEVPRCDHFAWRTVSGVGFGWDEIGLIFGALGFQQGGILEIPELKVNARWFNPPREEPELEKMFVSVVDLGQFSDLGDDELHELYTKILVGGIEVSRRTIDRVVENLTSGCVDRESRALDSLLGLFTTQNPWRFGPLSQNDFMWVAERSQALASVLAHGFTPNHFTLLLNKDPAYRFRGYTTMESWVKIMQDLDIRMKPEIEEDDQGFLCQTSTLAREREFKTRDGARMAWPGPYIEFIDRRRGFEGFVPMNARGIYDSTRPQE